MKSLEPKINIFNGPNIYSSYRAIVACYRSVDLTKNQKPANYRSDKLKAILPTFLVSKLKQSKFQNIDEMIMFLLDLLLNSKVKTGLSCELVTGQDDKKTIIIHQLNEAVTVNAIRITFLIASYMLSELNRPSQELINQVGNHINRLLYITPGMAISEMQYAADKFKVPFYIINYPTQLILYGQGKNGHLFDYASSEGNSHIGYKLQHDKTLCSALLNNLGYPGTEQATTSNLQECHALARQMGYPLVVKPPSETRGNGITANIRNDRKLAMAFHKAMEFSKGSIIIEKHVAGDDHRFTIINGKINGISRKIVAQVVGDGKNTIKKLIKIENKRRQSAKGGLLYSKLIEIDDDLLKVLNYDGHNINSKPKKDEIIYLRDVANLSQGGIPVLLTEKDVHPDNIAMMYDVTKSFRLNSVGIDFVTPDVSKSWRECGKIIEINSSPLVSERLAINLIENQFSDRNFGRIDTVLIVTNDKNFAKSQFRTEKGKYNCPAFSSSGITLIDDCEKSPASDSLYDRCKSVLLNPDCDFLMVSMNPDEIVNFGLPLDKFDRFIIDENSTYKDQQLNNLFNEKTGKTTLKDWLEDVFD